LKALLNPNQPIAAITAVLTWRFYWTRPCVLDDQ